MQQTQLIETATHSHAAQNHQRNRPRSTTASHTKPIAETNADKTDNQCVTQPARPNVITTPTATTAANKVHCHLSTLAQIHLLTRCLNTTSSNTDTNTAPYIDSGANQTLHPDEQALENKRPSGRLQSLESKVRPANTPKCTHRGTA